MINNNFGGRVTISLLCVMALMAILTYYSPLVNATNNLNHPEAVPTPSYLQSSQPRCAQGTLSILAAELLNKHITPNEWSLVSTDETDTVEDVIAAWKLKTNRRIVQVDKVAYGMPYIWVGTFDGGSHMCVAYFSENYVMLKQDVYDPYTRTNYMVNWDYSTFYSNTAAIYLP